MSSRLATVLVLPFAVFGCAAQRDEPGRPAATIITSGAAADEAGATGEWSLYALDDGHVRVEHGDRSMTSREGEVIDADFADAVIVALAPSSDEVSDLADVEREFVDADRGDIAGPLRSAYVSILKSKGVLAALRSRVFATLNRPALERVLSVYSLEHALYDGKIHSVRAGLHRVMKSPPGERPLDFLLARAAAERVMDAVRTARAWPGPAGTGRQRTLDEVVERTTELLEASLSNGRISFRTTGDVRVAVDEKIVRQLVFVVELETALNRLARALRDVDGLHAQAFTEFRNADAWTKLTALTSATSDLIAQLGRVLDSVPSPLEELLETLYRIH